MVIALAGRRVDAPNTDQQKFPSENAARVQQEISDFLKSANAEALVSAAACGADLLALEAAGELGIRRRIVLPYDKEAFKQSSVIDRSAGWGARYDRIMAEVESSGDLIELDYERDQHETYFAANHDILDEAEDLAEELGQELNVLVVWNGQSRGEDDVTGHFVEEAKNRGLKVSEISTL
jgi:hypothetical protein